MKKTEKTCPRVIRKSRQQLVRLSMCSQSIFHVLPNLKSYNNPQEVGTIICLPLQMWKQRDRSFIAYKVTQLMSDEMGFESRVK